MPSPYSDLLDQNRGVPPGATAAEVAAVSQHELTKGYAADELAKARNPNLRVGNRILASEQDYQDAIGYYRAKAEEMQAREAPTMDWGQANQDRAAYQQDRARQEAFSAQLLAQANGTGGPSVAERQMQAGLATGQQQSRAMAASARGGALAQAGANRLAMQQAGNMAGATNQQAGVLRAQEQAAARGEYAQMLAGMQGQNAQQRSLSQGQAVAGAQNEAGQRGRNDAAAQGMYGAEASQRGELYSGRVTQEGNLMGANAGQASLNAQIAQNKQQRSDQKTSAALGTAATIGAAALMFSDVRMKQDIAPVIPAAGGAPQWDAQAWAEKPAQWNPQEWASQGKPAAQAGGMAGTGAQEQGLTNAQKMQMMGMAGQVGGNLGTIFSDENLKTGATPLRGGSIGNSAPRAAKGGAAALAATAAASPVAEQMREATPYRYQYKDPADGAGDRYGPMAQDLARTESGRSMVVETPRGLAIDGKAAIPNLMAQTATLQRQLDEMRAKLGKKGGK